jgi:hypothetical protein
MESIVAMSNRPSSSHSLNFIEGRWIGRSAGDAKQNRAAIELESRRVFYLASCAERPIHFTVFARCRFGEKLFRLGKGERLRNSNNPVCGRNSADGHAR